MSTPIEQWVDEVARLTRPKRIVWCDGSEAEYHRLVEEMLRTGTLIELNQAANPGSYLHSSEPNDVALTEHLTFVCPRDREDACPNNNWMSPAEPRERLTPLFDRAMRDRTI